MSAARWVVRLPDGRRACATCDGGCRAAYVRDEPEFTKLGFGVAYDRDRALAAAKRRGGKLVRLLSPAESRRKAAATALRELAVSMRERATGAGRRAKDWEERGDSGSAQYELGLCVALVSAAEEAESRADALWPRKGAGR